MALMVRKYLSRAAMQKKPFKEVKKAHNPLYKKSLPCCHFHIENYDMLNITREEVGEFLQSCAIFFLDECNDPLAELDFGGNVDDFASVF